MKPAKIGLIQVGNRVGNGYRERTDEMYEKARLCLEAGADLVCFPEAYQYVGDPQITEEPERLLPLTQAWQERCAGLAKHYSAYVVPWDYECCGEKVYNTSYILDRNGKEIGRYRKVHLPYEELLHDHLESGEDFPVFDLDIGKVGIMICFDNFFPESARCLGNRGAQLVLYPLYGDTNDPQWEIRLRARAIDSGMYIVPTATDPASKAWTGIVGVDGTVLESLRSEGWTVAEIDMERENVTHLLGEGQSTENLRKMLARTRNPKAYRAIGDEPKTTDWEEIYYGKLPYGQKSKR